MVVFDAVYAAALRAEMREMGVPADEEYVVAQSTVDLSTASVPALELLVRDSIWVNHPRDRDPEIAVAALSELGRRAKLTCP